MPDVDLPRTRAKLAALAVALSLPAAPARADGYVMGAGRWTCAEVTGMVDGGDAGRIGQAAGWVLGSWSTATFQRETRFVDIVEQVGGTAIWDKTVAECRTTPPDTMLYRVVNAMISSTQ